MKNILIIDDDIAIGDMLGEALELEGYGVLRAYSGTEALMLLGNARPALILLDLMLPGLSGEELLPRIKDIPVIVLSAKTDIEGKVALLLGGAADYVTKPFNVRELTARIAVALRGKSANSARISYGGITVDVSAHTAEAGGKEVRLTRTEFALLRVLCENEGRAVSRSALLDRISLDTPDCTESSLKIHVSNLRRKLRDADGEEHIEAVWGIGFRLV